MPKGYPLLKSFICFDTDKVYVEKGKDRSIGDGIYRLDFVGMSGCADYMCSI